MYIYKSIQFRGLPPQVGTVDLRHQTSLLQQNYNEKSVCAAHCTPVYHCRNHLPHHLLTLLTQILPSCRTNHVNQATCHNIPKEVVQKQIPVDRF